MSEEDEGRKVREAARWGEVEEVRRLISTGTTGSKLDKISKVRKQNKPILHSLLNSMRIFRI